MNKQPITCQSFIEKMNDGIIQVDKNLNIVYCNPRVCDILGKPLSELLAKPMASFLDSHNQKILEHEFKKRESGGNAPYEMEFSINNNETISTVIVPHPIFNKNGEFEGSFSVITDITKQKKAEQALKASEEKLSTIFNNNFQFHALLGADGKVIDINDTALSFVGITKDKVIGKYYWETPWWNHDKHIQLDLQNALKQVSMGEMTHFETIHINNKGEKRYIDITLKPVTDRNNKIIYLVSEGYDFTEQRNMTQSLYENKKKYQLLFESASIGIIVVKDTIMTDCNKMTLDMFKCSKEEFLGKTPIDFSPKYQPDGSLSETKALEQLDKVKNGAPQKFEWTHSTFTGKTFIAEISLNSVVINKISFVMAFIRDITDKKQAERALKESEEKYRNLVELANDGVIIIQDGLLKYINSNFMKLLGYTHKETLNQSLEKFIHPDDIAFVIDNYKKRIKGEINSSLYNFRIINKKKQIVTIEANVMRILYQGKPASFGFMRDVTDRLKLQKKLAFAEKMSTIGELSRKVAHEIGNPLSSILHSASELSDTLSLSGDDKILMDIILKETKRLNVIIKNFLNYSRPKQPEYKLTNIEKLIDEILLVIQNDQTFKDKNISIKKQIKNENFHIPIDQDMIKEVLWNIILNARDAIEKNGLVNISLKNTENSDKKSLLLSIENNGPAIPEENLEKIFEPYFTSKFYGSGLGLATVKKNIAEHDGTITVESSTTNGTKFDITLPVSRSQKN